MELPPIPKLQDFPGHEYGYNAALYKDALAAWERLCTLIVELEKKVK